jgi:hypothetical protein
VGCVTIHDTKDIVAVLEVTYTSTFNIATRVVGLSLVTHKLTLYVPSIDQIFKFLKRPMNAVESLNVSLVVTI